MTMNKSGILEIKATIRKSTEIIVTDKDTNGCQS